MPRSTSGGCTGHPDNWSPEEYATCPECDSILEDNVLKDYESCDCGWTPPEPDWELFTEGTP